MFGNLKNSNTILFADINFREFSILLPLLILMLLMGVYPKYFLNFIHLASSNLFLITIL